MLLQPGLQVATLCRRRRRARILEILLYILQCHL